MSLMECYVTTENYNYEDCNNKNTYHIMFKKTTHI